MKIFVSCKYSGEDVVELGEIMGKIHSSLEKAGHTVFSSFGEEEMFKKKNFSNKHILEHCLRELDTSDCVLAFVKSPEKSEGMLLEVGYALAKGKRIILAIKSGIKMNFLPQIASEVIEFKTYDELYSKLESFN